MTDELVKKFDEHSKQDDKHFNDIGVKLEVLLTRFNDHIREQEKRDVKRDDKLDQVQKDVQGIFSNIQQSITLSGDVRSIDKRLRATEDVVKESQTDLSWLKRSHWMVATASVSSVFGFIFLIIRLFLMQ